jgi:hypothetical protein
MSVNRTDYIVYGWKLSYEPKDSKGNKIDLWDDKYLPMIEGHKGEKYSIIRDGMSGRYTIFGIILEKADEYEGWGILPIDIERYHLAAEVEPLRSKLKELFDVQHQFQGPFLFILSHFH